MVLEKYNRLKHRGQNTSIVFCPIPSYIGEKGNKHADNAAKERYYSPQVW